MEKINVFGAALIPCCFDPLTGYFRDGYCRIDDTDHGKHLICAQMTEDFLKFSFKNGNDLITPRPQYMFPGLKPGDYWCVCALRWKEAYDAGFAPPVKIEACAEEVLQYVTIDMLIEHAIRKKYNTFLAWNFDHTYYKVHPKLTAKALPQMAFQPELLIFNETLAKALGIFPAEINPQNLAIELSGSAIHPAAYPVAMAYAGHQFGHFNMLGDGRAILLGEHITPSKERLDIHFKGSGITPFSRRGDGKASIKPMLREYIISEAMHHLGIKSTRSLAVVKTGEIVYRNIEQEGAVLTRIASSHIRVGTFEYVSRFLSKEALQEFTEYTISRHFPYLSKSQNLALALLEETIDKQIDLIAQWLRVGFIHGVMNTDNMSIAGETIDYGPCAFMNAYNPNTVYSSIDHHGRYAFGNQAPIAHWNLVCLANALLPIIHPDIKEAAVLAQTAIDGFQAKFSTQWNKILLQKIGISDEEEGDLEMATSLLRWMENNHADYTNTFSNLIDANMLLEFPYNQNSFVIWYQEWQKRMARESEKFFDWKTLMNQTNPKVIPRNHLIEYVLDQAADFNNYAPFHKMLEILQAPYSTKPIDKEYLEMPTASQEQKYQTFCGT
jgi:uncharacterized protein YdiU (UPF0061 family)/uncharacterized protein (DUF2237 family)